MDKKGRKKLIYIKTPEMNMLSKATKYRKAEPLFNNKKFASRTGSLLKSFTPAGSWSGNRLNMMGDGGVEIQETKDGVRAVIKFTGSPERTLRHAGFKGKVDITDTKGTVVDTAGINRNPMAGFKKTINVWNGAVKKELDAKARAMK